MSHEQFISLCYALASLVLTGLALVCVAACVVGIHEIFMAHKRELEQGSQEPPQDH